MPSQMPDKDPAAKLDYMFDWTTWLDDDVIEDATFTAVGVTAEAGDIANKTAVVWVSGGTAGQRYDVTCHITTAGGRVDERSITIPVRNR